MKGFTGNEQNLSDVINKVTSAYESDADVYYGLFHGKIIENFMINFLSEFVKSYRQL